MVLTAAHRSRHHAEFRAKFKGVEELGAPPATQSSTFPAVPWLLKTGLTPETADAKNENWCGVMQEVTLSGSGGDAGAFMRAATKYANEQAWGTLSCAVIAHPRTQKQYAAEFDETLAALRYGCIVVNGPTILGFATAKMTWGAFPGNTPTDIGSGNCFVHNTYLFDHPQKSVLRAPWRFVPKPFWATDHKNQERLAHRALEFMGHPSIANLLVTVPEALKG